MAKDNKHTHMRALKDGFERWFHPRKLLIVSEHKVKQISISTSVQVCIIMMLASGLVWSSYATGRFITTSITLKEQNSVLRSVANSKIDNVFSKVMPKNSLPQDSGVPDAPLGFSSLSNDPNLMKVAMLEQQITELKSANELIVERVRAKTSGHIDDLESIIRQTGLNPVELKKQAEKIQKKNDKLSEGGPYVPSHLEDMTPGATSLFSNLDEMDMLRQIVENLPLATPIKNYDEQSTFGHRIDPFNGHLAFHSGVDLAGAYGASITAAADGKVVAAGRDGAYGNMIDIDHGYSIVTRYGHLSRIDVRVGQMVKKDEHIAAEGSTGRSTGPHLHYEVRYHDQPINPKNFLKTGKLLEAANAVSQE